MSFTMGLHVDLFKKNIKRKKHNKKNIITYVGRLKKRKGSYILFDIISILKKRGRGI